MCVATNRVMQVKDDTVIKVSGKHMHDKLTDVEIKLLTAKRELKASFSTEIMEISGLPKKWKFIRDLSKRENNLKEAKTTLSIIMRKIKLG
ncbi:unnamed protein product [Brachionus calyciflorus]|uniref:Uncharacterized protein n=1 Tax=Brachionus calyciflorus TaxID=104777 RepID=A0A814A6W9_9BILA|nr:unnamed protein product [Brachionus calyciflorus]